MSMSDPAFKTNKRLALKYAHSTLLGWYETIVAIKSKV